eukprot:6195192-Pleurochrysis_carterae.AAC.1
MHATGVASSTPAIAAESVATNTLIPAAASATAASSPMSQGTSPGDKRFSWPPEPVHVPPPPTPVVDDFRRVLRVAREDEEKTELNAPCTRRLLAGPAVRRNSRLATTSEPEQFWTWPGYEAAAVPVPAAHTEIGVRVKAPPRTESSIPVPMATNLVTRQLPFNAMNSQLEAMRPIAPDGQVALHIIHLVIFTQRMHAIHQTLDDYIWVATFKEHWGVDMWPEMFTQASKPDLSTMSHLRELIRSSL